MSTTHFGYRTVAEDEKSSLVRGVFDSVASRYDLMNDLMSAGMHRLWKNDFVSWLAPRDGMRIVDVAGGTGDIAFRLLDKAQCHVTVCDINQSMLMEGRNRATDRNILRNIDWVCADAESMPLPSGTFDAYTIAFGIRNVTRIDKAIAEAYRLLKPGGRFMCLEFSQLKHGWMQKIYDTYSFTAIPKMGAFVTGSADPYQYLVESIRKFPNQDTFADLTRAGGFGNVQYRNLTQGVVAMHSGRKL